MAKLSAAYLPCANVAPKTKHSCIPGVATSGPNPKAGSLFVLSFHLKRGEPQNSTNKVGVPGTGLEPARLATHAPQACVSANFTTRARGIKVDYFLNFETFKARGKWLLFSTVCKNSWLNWNLNRSIETEVSSAGEQLMRDKLNRRKWKEDVR